MMKHHCLITLTAGQKKKSLSDFASCPFNETKPNTFLEISAAFKISEFSETQCYLQIKLKVDIPM